MNNPEAARFQSIGEIFDRAVSVMLKNFLPLSLAYGIVILPLRVVVDWLNRAYQVRQASAVGAVITNPQLVAQFFRLSYDPNDRFSLGDAVRIALEMIVGALAAGVFAAVTIRVLRGERPDTFNAFPRALNLWFRLAVLHFATLFLLVLSFAGGVAIWIFLWNFWPSFREPDSAAALTLAMSLLLACIFAACYYCAFGAVAVDDRRIGSAARLAWKMTTVRALRSRSLAFGSALVACYVIGALFSLAVEGIADLLFHHVAAGVALRELFTLEVGVLIGVAGIVFYLDAKARYSAIQDAVQNRENSAAR
jgi:hypothetical protein